MYSLFTKPFKMLFPKHSSCKIDLKSIELPFHCTFIPHSRSQNLSLTPSERPALLLAFTYATLFKKAFLSDRQTDTAE